MSGRVGHRHRPAVGVVSGVRLGHVHGCRAAVVGDLFDLGDVALGWRGVERAVVVGGADVRDHLARAFDGVAAFDCDALHPARIVSHPGTGVGHVLGLGALVIARRRGVALVVRLRLETCRVVEGVLNQRLAHVSAVEVGQRTGAGRTGEVRGGCPPGADSRGGLVSPDRVDGLGRGGAVGLEVGGGLQLEALAGVGVGIGTALAVGEGDVLGAAVIVAAVAVHAAEVAGGRSGSGGHSLRRTTRGRWRSRAIGTRSCTSPW